MSSSTSIPFSRRLLLAGSAALAAAAAEEPIRLPRKIRVAILGMDGHPGEILNPLPRLPDVEIVAISDASDADISHLKENPRLSGMKRYADYRELLDRETIDVAAVLGPPNDRPSRLLACAERKLNIVSEKPLAIEHKDLERVRAAIAKSGVRLTMLLPMRFIGRYRALKQVVDSGEIGEVAQIASQASYRIGTRAPWYKKRSTYGGTIPWVGVHLLDMMRHTSGREFTEVAAFHKNIGFPEVGEMENVAAVLFHLDNGGVATMRLDYFRPAEAPPGSDDRLRLAGTKGVVEYAPASGLTVLSRGKKQEVIREMPPSISLFVDFLESVYNGKPAGLPLNDIYRINEIVLGARDAADQRKVVKL